MSGIKKLMHKVKDKLDIGESHHSEGHTTKVGGAKLGARIAIMSHAPCLAVMRRLWQGRGRLAHAPICCPKLLAVA